MNYIHAFWVGGLICALVQILLDKTRLMPGRVMVLLVCTGSVLSALHLYEPLVDYAGAGASVPLIGFGHLLFQGVKEEMEQVGVLGVFTGGLKASAGGISAALIFGYLASLFSMRDSNNKKIPASRRFAAGQGYYPIKCGSFPPRKNCLWIYSRWNTAAHLQAAAAQLSLPHAGLYPLPD